MINYQLFKKEVKETISDLKTLGYTDESYSVQRLNNIYNVIYNIRTNQRELEQEYRSFVKFRNYTYSL